MEAQIQVQVFVNEQFGTLRSITIDGEEWFVGKDAATSLEYKDTDQAIRVNVDDRDKKLINAKMLQKMASESKHVQNTNVKFNSPRGLMFINLSGLFSLILSSKMEKAKEYRHCVTSEVLQKTHGYIKNTSVAEAQEPATKNLPPHLVDLKRRCVYVNAMSNGTVKIGKTNNYRRRANEIRRKTNLEIIKAYRTDYLPAPIASDIETTCHRTFATYRTQGEYFKISFEEACAEVSERARTIIETNRVLYRDKWIDANEECDKFLAEIPVREADIASELSLEEKLYVLLKCVELAPTDELKIHFLQRIDKLI